MSDKEIDNLRNALIELFMLSLAPQRSNQEHIQETVNQIKSRRSKPSIVRGFLDIDEAIRPEPFNRSDFINESEYNLALNEKSEIDRLYQEIFRKYKVNIYEFILQKNKKIGRILDRGYIENAAEYRILFDFVSDCPIEEGEGIFAEVDEILQKFDHQKLHKDT